MNRADARALTLLEHWARDRLHSAPPYDEAAVRACSALGLVVCLELADYELRGLRWSDQLVARERADWEQVRVLILRMHALRIALRSRVQQVLELVRDLREERPNAAAQVLVAELLVPLWARHILPTAALIGSAEGGPPPRTRLAYDIALASHPPPDVTDVPDRAVPFVSWVDAVATSARPGRLSPQRADAASAYVVTAAATGSKDGRPMLRCVPALFAVHQQAALLPLLLTLLPSRVARPRPSNADGLMPSLIGAPAALQAAGVSAHRHVWLDVEDWPGGAWSPAAGYGGESAGLMLASALAGHAWSRDVRANHLASVGLDGEGRWLPVGGVPAKLRAATRLGVERMLLHQQDAADADCSGVVIVPVAGGRDRPTEGLLRTLDELLLVDPYANLLELLQQSW